jgi:hypothetical protein
VRHRREPKGVRCRPGRYGWWYPHLHLLALSGEAWETVQRAPDILLDRYGYPGEALSRLIPDPAPLAGLHG